MQLKRAVQSILDFFPELRFNGAAVCCLNRHGDIRNTGNILHFSPFRTCGSGFRVYITCVNMTQATQNERNRVIMSAKGFHERIMPKLRKLDPASMRSCIQHLSREHGFLENIFNTIGEAVLVIDDSLHILYHNAAAKNMLGLPDELTHLTVRHILKGLNWEAILPKGHQESTKLVRQELELTYPEHRIVQFQTLPIQDTDTRYILLFNDITATVKKAASSAEDERSKIVSMLAAGVAHEIGNPLNSLYLHLQFLQRLLKTGEFDPEEALSEVTEARAEVERLDTIINQFLHAVRPGKPSMQALDLKTLVLESLNFMRHEIADRQIHVDFIWGDGIPLINGDAGQLKQAFYNLVKNAVQAMSSGGCLGVACNADDDFVSLAVSDSGPGIRKEDIARIFQPYFTTKSKGTGLGLMIVERIIREHGGSISVESEPGKGTTFILSFPRRDRMVKVLPPAPEHDDIKEQE